MMLIINLFFYSVILLTSTTISNGAAAALNTENLQQQKQTNLRNRVLKQNDTKSQIQQFEQHHKVEENFDISASSKSTTTKLTTNNNKNITLNTTMNDNDDVDNKSFMTKRRQLTGKFTIVKANQPSETKLNDIILGEFNNGDYINIYGYTSKQYSMYIDHAGPMDHLFFQYSDAKNKLIRKNSTTFEPFALTYHKGHKFDSLDILTIPGNHKIDITGYLFDRRLANIILSFTIINDPSKPPSLVPLSSRISKRKKPKKM